MNPLYGDNATKDVQLSNNGPTISTQSFVSFSISPGFQYVQAFIQMGTYSGSTWNVGNLRANQTTSMALVLKVKSAILHQLIGLAGTQSFEPNPSNNNVTVMFPPTAAYDLPIQKTVDVENPF